MCTLMLQLSGLSVDDAHTSTGDIRAVLTSLLALLNGEIVSFPDVLGQTCTIAVTPEVQTSGLTRTSYLVRIMKQPSGYVYPNPTDYVQWS